MEFRKKLPQECFIVKSTSDKEPYYVVALDDKNIVIYPASSCVCDFANKIENGMHVKIDGYMEAAGYIEEIKPVLTAYPQSKDPAFKNLKNFDNLITCFDAAAGFFMNSTLKGKLPENLDEVVKGCNAGLTDYFEKISKENDIKITFNFADGRQLDGLDYTKQLSASIAGFMQGILTMMPKQEHKKIDYLKQYFNCDTKLQITTSNIRKELRCESVNQMCSYVNSMINHCKYISFQAHNSRDWQTLESAKDNPRKPSDETTASKKNTQVHKL